MVGGIGKPGGGTEFSAGRGLLATADHLRLFEVEGKAFEKLVGHLYEERSRKGIGDFPLTERIKGFWDRGGTEIDLVALTSRQGDPVRFM